MTLSVVEVPPMVPLPRVSEGRSPLPMPMQLCEAGEFTRMRDASTRSPNSRIAWSFREWMMAVWPRP